MKIIDLSHHISSDMPVYPGKTKPVIIEESSIAKKGYVEKNITFSSHIGTHMDAPAHMVEGSKTLDKFPVEQFYGEAFILNHNVDKGNSIGIEELEPYQDIIRDVDFLLINTGWSKYWGDIQYYSKYPVLSQEAAKWL